MSRILDFPIPPDEQWSIRIDPGPDTLELVATGPERGKEAHLGWQAERVREGVEYRRLLRGTDDRRPEAMRRALRSLIWHRIVFRPNPIVSIDPTLAEAFEETVWEALRRRRHGAVRVHFNVWQEDADVRFVCKVEALPNGSAEAGRRWWSPLVRDPEDLAAALAAAYPQAPGDDALVPPTSGSLKRSASLTAPSGA